MMKKNKKPYKKFKDTTKEEYENKKKRFPMIPKEEFDIRFENNPDFYEKGFSRASVGGLMRDKKKRLEELDAELGIRRKKPKTIEDEDSERRPDSIPPKRGPNYKGMKKGGDIDARVEEELKKETPNAYPMMKGLSPITHLRRYLKKRELLSKKEKGIGLYDSPKTESKSGFGKVFKEARKKGEGTKFKYKEKDYSAVTKEDVSKSGKSSLKDYLDSPSKMKSGGSVMVKTKLGRNKPTRLY
jgi:hypothetical protein